MNDAHRCMACGRVITWRFAICSSCEVTYGRSALSWPAWLRTSWNEEQRKRRRDRRELQHEITFSDLISEESEDMDVYIG